MLAAALVLAAQLQSDEPGVFKRIPSLKVDAATWSRDGLELAWMDGHDVRTSKGFKISLPAKEFEHWLTLTWSPDGNQIAVYGTDHTKIVDVRRQEVVENHPQGTLIWWLGEKRCQAVLKSSFELGSEDVQSWFIEGKQRKLPRGISLENVSPSGRAFLAIENGYPHDGLKGLLVLLVVNDEGQLVWTKRLVSQGRLDMRGRLFVDWNEKHQIAARVVDNAASELYKAFVESRTQEFALTETDGENYWSSSGIPRWVDERHLAVPLNMAFLYSPDSKTTRSVNHSRLAVFDAETNQLRPVYESNLVPALAASAHFVALRDTREGHESIILTLWQRTNEGRIAAVKFRPPDPYDGKQEDWDRFLQNLDPLKGRKSDQPYRPRRRPR